MMAPMVSSGIKLAHVLLPERAVEFLPLGDPPKGITHNFDRQLLPSGQGHLALISFDGRSYKAIGIMEKEASTSSFQCRVRCSFIQSIRSISFDLVKKSLKKSILKRVSDLLAQEIGPYTDAGGRDVLTAIQSTHPSVTKAIREVMGHLQKRGSIRLQEASPWTVVRQEWDAVDTAVSLADLPPTRIDLSVLNEDAPAPILSLLGRNALEDRQIDQDANVFGGLILKESDARGQRTFYDPMTGKKVTVVNVNRHAIEKTLGVDLIVYFDEYKSYLLVQYKRLTSTEISSRGKKFNASRKARCYPSRDKNFSLDLSRMKDAKTALGIQPIVSSADYRLNDDPFYFKFCRADSFDPDSKGMVKGLYILASDLEHFIASAASKGDGGGRSIGFDNLRRRFPNSLFIDLARSGWIGSREIGSKRIYEYLEKALRAGRSVMVADVRLGVRGSGITSTADEDFMEESADPWGKGSI
jgi:hypothetical protein